VTRQLPDNPGPDARSPSELQRWFASIHHASSAASRFYGTMSRRIDYPLGYCFQSLKKLHSNLKEILSAELSRAGPQPQASPQRTHHPVPPCAESGEVAGRYASLSILSSNPGAEVLDYLVVTEQRQKRLQTGTLEALDDTPLKIAISAQTAMLQITIDRMVALLDEDLDKGVSGEDWLR